MGAFLGLLLVGVHLRSEYGFLALAARLCLVVAIVIVVLLLCIDNEDVVRIEIMSLP